MSAKIFSMTPYGLDAKIVRVEVDVSAGLPATFIVGLADTSIKESKIRVRAGLKNSGYFKYPVARVIVNLAPANINKYGTHFDFPIAVAILIASEQIKVNLEHAVLLGEISLDGSLRAVKSCLPMVLEAKRAGFRQVYLPEQNYNEAKLVSGIEIIPLQNLDHFFEIASGKYLPLPRVVSAIRFVRQENNSFGEIIGQRFAKRGLEIAAAGGHNILLFGSPGVGKTMLGKALASILPTPTKEQILETAKIYSSLGLLQNNFVINPFRAPHHSVTMPAFIGGGKYARPGELSLAHNDILFMDEFPEFPRSIIEALRQPLEQGTIQVSRLENNYVFPARFIFIAAQNPCPCGYFQDPDHDCNCTINQIQNYRKRISGPILDRIDLQIRVLRNSDKHPGSGEGSARPESSKEVLTRIQAARDRQHNRANKLNSELSPNEVKQFCILDQQTQNLLASAEQKYKFSQRTYARILKLGRTIADLENRNEITAADIATAIQYRLPD